MIQPTTALSAYAQSLYSATLCLTYERRVDHVLMFFYQQQAPPGCERVVFELVGQARGVAWGVLSKGTCMVLLRVTLLNYPRRANYV